MRSNTNTILGLALWMATGVQGQRAPCPDPCGTFGTLDASETYTANPECLLENPRFANLCAALDFVSGESCSSLGTLVLNDEQCGRLPELAAASDCCFSSIPTFGTPCRPDPCADLGAFVPSQTFFTSGACFQDTPSNVCRKLLPLSGTVTCKTLSTLELTDFQCSSFPGLIEENCCDANGVVCQSPCGTNSVLDPFETFELDSTCTGPICEVLAPFSNIASCSEVADTLLLEGQCADLPKALTDAGCCRLKPGENPGTFTDEAFTSCGSQICTGLGIVDPDATVEVPRACDLTNSVNICSYLNEKLAGRPCSEAAESELFFASECAALPAIIGESCCAAPTAPPTQAPDTINGTTQSFIALLIAFFAALFRTQD